MKKRTAPTLKDPTIQRAISDIYTILNELIDSVSGVETQKGSEGSEGKINVVKTSTGEYQIEIKHKDGWLGVPANKRKSKIGH